MKIWVERGAEEVEKLVINALGSMKSIKDNGMDDGVEQ
jgi:hypothetical protein